jgi:hypothetical protein
MLFDLNILLILAYSLAILWEHLGEDILKMSETVNMTYLENV